MALQARRSRLKSILIHIILWHGAMLLCALLPPCPAYWYTLAVKVNKTHITARNTVTHFQTEDYAQALTHWRSATREFSKFPAAQAYNFWGWAAQHRHSYGRHILPSSIEAAKGVVSSAPPASEA